MFNEIDGDFDDVAIRKIKVGLPIEHDLRKSSDQEAGEECSSAYGSH